MWHDCKIPVMYTCSNHLDSCGTHNYHIFSGFLWCIRNFCMSERVWRSSTSIGQLKESFSYLGYSEALLGLVINLCLINDTVKYSHKGFLLVFRVISSWTTLVGLTVQYCCIF